MPANCAIAIRPSTVEPWCSRITQSGETADTLAAMREMKRKGHPTLAICNVVGSTIAQEADGGIYLHAGTEIGVASTKAYTSQCLVLAMLALYFGRMHHLSYNAGRAYIEGFQQLPDLIDRTLKTNDEVRRIAEKYHHCQNFLYLGRQHNFPTALEGALEAERNQLHPRRRLSGRGNEARPHRVGRREHAQRVHHAAGIHLRQSHGECRRGQGAGGPVIADRVRRGSSASGRWPTT